MKILIVDDENAALHNFLDKVLDDSTLKYAMYQDPYIAIERAETFMPRAAFLDINMPEMDGVTLAKRLIKINPAIHIVFISGYVQNENVIRQKLGDNLLGFCYKPYDGDTLYKYLNLIAAQGNLKADIKTFGIFETFAMGKPIHFSNAKSKELLALLIHNDCKYVSMNICIAALWPDRPLEQAKRLYRDSKIRLRTALKTVGLENLVLFFRGGIAANRECIASCDLWLAEETGDYSAYCGEYMIQYGEWSLEKQYYLDMLAKR